MGDADTTNQYPDKRVKLYLRFPHSIETQQEVKQLYAGITSVFLPRQKSRRWCVVTLKSSEIFKEARCILRKIKIDNKRIVVTPFSRINKERTARITLKKAEKRAVRKGARKVQSRSHLAAQARNTKAVEPIIKTDSLVDLLQSES